MPDGQNLDSWRLLNDQKLILNSIYQKIILLPIKMIKEKNFKGKQLNCSYQIKVLNGQSDIVVKTLFFVKFILKGVS